MIVPVIFHVQFTSVLVFKFLKGYFYSDTFKNVIFGEFLFYLKRRSSIRRKVVFFVFSCEEFQKEIGSIGEAFREIINFLLFSYDVTRV